MKIIQRFQRWGVWGDPFPRVVALIAASTPGYVISGFQPESHFYPFAEGEKYHSLGQRPRNTIPTNLLWLKAKNII